MFKEPMLAATLKDLQILPGQYHAEEKFDGHRLIVEVSSKWDLFGHPNVTAWSRNAIGRILPRHVREELVKLPPGTYDGELIVPGGHSFGVTELSNADTLVYVLFDVLELDGMGNDVTSYRYLERREMLQQIASRLQLPNGGLHLAVSTPVDSMEETIALRDAVWARNGEGLILKHVDSPYEVGKRSKAWRKIKQLKTAVLKVIGYHNGKLGPHSVLKLEDPEGNQTTVKWKDYTELDRLDADPESFIGRELRIEFQDRTPDGSYRHPRWDRWENE